VGKLLPTFYVVGKETHAGEVFNGLDAHQLNAELVRLVNLNPDLMDQAEGEVTVPPVSLLSAGLRDAYNVQTTLEAWSYFNLLTHCRSVSQVMEQMVSLAKEAAGNVEEHYRRSYTAFADASHLPADRSISIGVHTYESLAKVVGQGVDIEIPEGEDPRVTSRRIIQELWQKSGLPRPAIIAYLSPPYYPHSFISAEEAGTNPFIRSAVAVADGAGLVSRKFYPYISDGSFLRFSGQADDLVKHMPLWRRGGSGYSIPLEEMRTLNLPVANLGPFGKDAHQLTERVHAPYSFGTLPGLIEQVVRGTFERG
jgi:arginine utilization protein RocB